VKESDEIMKKIVAHQRLLSKAIDLGRPSEEISKRIGVLMEQWEKVVKQENAPS
jgi:hypothetical protein